MVTTDKGWPTVLTPVKCDGPIPCGPLKLVLDGAHPQARTGLVTFTIAGAGEPAAFNVAYGVRLLLSRGTLLVLRFCPWCGEKQSAEKKLRSLKGAPTECSSVGQRCRGMQLAINGASRAAQTGLVEGLFPPHHVGFRCKTGIRGKYQVLLLKLCPWCGVTLLRGKVRKLKKSPGDHP